MRGNHYIRSYSTTQAAPSLSSGESEYHGLTKAASSAIGMQSMGRDLGEDLTTEVGMDASAAIAMAKRRGVGRVRHLHTMYLWVQHLVYKKMLNIAKVPGSDNAADVGTKHVDERTLWKHMEFIGQHSKQGKSKIALKAAL